MLILLCKKVDKLEQENKEIKKILHQYDKKKQNILELLNNTYSLEKNIDDFLEEYLKEINTQMIEKIATNPLVLLVVNLLIQQIKKSKNQSPFYYCKEKQEIYVYTKEWVSFQTTLLKDFVKKIQNKLIHIYFEWKKQKEEENKTKNLDEISTQIIMKISLFHEERIKLKKKFIHYLQEINE
jgi:nitrogenase subunit NifH